MKKVFSFLFCCATALTVFAQAPRLSFNNEGSFKITQFSDLHLQVQHPDECAKVFARIDYMLNLEKPDLVVITGDMIFSRPAKDMLQQLVNKLDNHHTPWCLVYGNHDAEQEMSRPEMSQLIVKGKYTLDTLNGKGELADVELPVWSAKNPGQAAFYVYCMDSHDYSPIKGLSGYGWFSPDQVQWMRDCCQARTDANGQVAPAVAFFHIPLCEYVDAWAPQENARRGAANPKVGIGIRGENIAAGAINTGMFAAMRETGSIIGTFAGHDHDSDFVTAYKGIGLCYGRFSGCNTVYNNLLPGARIIVLREGVREFETWERLDDGRCINHVRCDGNEIVRQPSMPAGSLYGTKTEFPQ